LCNGAGLCIHKRIKHNCIECHGASICDHGKRRSRCLECKGGSVVHLDEEELERRVAQLINCINLHKGVEPAEQLTIEYLFYGLVYKCV